MTAGEMNPMDRSENEPALKVMIRVNRQELRWPKGGAAAFGYDANRSYEDLTRTRWSDVDAVLEEESRLIEQVALAEDAVREEAFEEAAENFAAPEQLGVILDLGVASATLALNAAGCPTITACSGHVAGFPYVAFWARTTKVDLLCRVAEAAGVGVVNAEDGLLNVYALPSDFHAMIRFARGLRQASAELRRIRTERPPAKESPQRHTRETQLGLPFEEAMDR